MIGTLPVRDPRDELRAKTQVAIDAWEDQVVFTRVLADHTVPDGRIDTVLYGLADSAWNLVWASAAYNVLGPDAGKARDVLVREAGRVDDIQHGRRMTNQEHLDALLEDFAEIFGEVNGTGSPEEHDIARPVAARMVYGLLYTVAHEQYRQLCGSGGEHPEDAARTSVSTNLAKYLQQLGVSGQEAEDVRAAILATLGASQKPVTAAA
jgi:hypothetical protein